MAAGVPVVTSRCYGVDMFCVDGDNALMVSPYDANAMSDALLKILQVPQVGWHRYGPEDGRIGCR